MWSVDGPTHETSGICLRVLASRVERDAAGHDLSKIVGLVTDGAHAYNRLAANPRV